MFFVDSHKCDFVRIRDPVLPKGAGEVLHVPEVLLSEGPGDLHKVCMDLIVGRRESDYILTFQ